MFFTCFLHFGLDLQLYIVHIYMYMSIYIYIREALTRWLSQDECWVFMTYYGQEVLKYRVRNHIINFGGKSATRYIKFPLNILLNESRILFGCLWNLRLGFRPWNVWFRIWVFSWTPTDKETVKKHVLCLEMPNCMAPNLEIVFGVSMTLRYRRGWKKLHFFKLEHDPKRIFWERLRFLFKTAMQKL